MSHLQQLDVAAARAFNVKRDLARERYVRTNFNAAINDPTSYDLVINTGRVHLTEAVELVAALVNARTPAAASATPSR